MADAAISKTGHAAAESSSTATLTTDRRSVMPSNDAVATALPKTSWAQDSTAAGVVVTSLETSRSSRLSRGRSISRCVPSHTGRR